MKQLIIGIIGLSVLLLGWSACSDDFEVNADWKEITIAYGLLDQSDNSHYIRIQKAFLNNDSDALEIAQISDSLYHKNNIGVELRALRGSAIQTITLTRVDAANENLVKEDGVFAQAPYYLYKTDTALDEDAQYELAIRNSENKESTARINLIKDFKVVRPDPEEKMNFSCPNRNSTDGDITETADCTYKIRWRAAENAVFHDMNLIFKYDEQKQGAERVSKRLTWQIVSNRPEDNEGENIEQTLSLYELTRFVENSLTIDETVTRFFTGMDLVFSSGSKELYDFQLINFAQFGISSGQAKPIYTNFEGEDILGLFASRYKKVVKDLELKAQNLTDFSCSSLLLPYNFAPHPTNQYYPDCPPR